MKFLKLLFFVFCFTVFTSFTAHKFYVSITKIEYVKEKQSIQIITQLFTDDLEDALSERYGKDVHLDSSKETKADVALFEKYLLSKLTILVNGNPVKYNFIGHKYDIDQVKAYIEITGIEAVNSMEIENTILMDKFENQQNIIHFKTGTSRKSLVLDKENPKGLLKFE
ncbi:hypothetical protein ULMS_26080 [Patiriisocius marinistellae]|uniref:Peptidase E n=1 Tax=Patiriisocius marinistellae TaxID=2494560 RepID=A0A5J4FXT8_9FLAO|nr:DUF6702 family protein [Patiriisocius marinistellae]GEQ87100.1 hypothetical protein ULMS_26080 [Patiriisocius marinistellae]